MSRIKKTFKIFSALVLILASLSLFSFCVAYVVKGGKRLGVFSAPIAYLASFPNMVLDVFRSSQIQGIPPTYEEIDPSFEEQNELDYDVYGLNGFYDKNENIWRIKLFNFRNDSVVHTWHIEKMHYNQGAKQFENSEPRNCIILPDKSLIVGCDDTYNLFRLDENSNIIWHNTSKVFHHSLNLDFEGNVWACSGASRGVKDYRNETRLYRDDHITKVSAETGEILFDKSVSEIFLDNGYKSFVYGLSNHIGDSESDIDPLHLNDIEPVLKDGQYWQKGDVFLSLRNRSLVFLYRPETNKIIHLLQGPFLNQHDVDIISATEISVFNNNVAEVGGIEHEEIIDEMGPPTDIDDDVSISEIIIYNFEDSVYSTYLEDQFKEEEIFTRTQGFHEHLSNGDVYVENQNNGKMYIMNEDKILLRKYFHTSIDNMAERPHWIRIYENITF